MNTWKKELEILLKDKGLTLKDITHYVVREPLDQDDEDLEYDIDDNKHWKTVIYNAIPRALIVEFCCRKYASEGASFYVYTDDYIIICAVYDGSEWLEAIPRNPTLHCNPDHIGG